MPYETTSPLTAQATINLGERRGTRARRKIYGVQFSHLEAPFHGADGYGFVWTGFIKNRDGELTPVRIQQWLGTDYGYNSITRRLVHGGFRAFKFITNDPFSGRLHWRIDYERRAADRKTEFDAAFYNTRIERSA